MRINRAARPQRYVFQATVQASLMSRTMLLTGLVILAFVIYHLLHFTFGVIYPEAYLQHDAKGRQDVYRMVVLGFQNPIITTSYVVAQVFLALHLWHGASSMFQTLGLSHSRFNPMIRWCGPGVAAIVTLGNISIPLAILLGLVRLPAGGGPP